MQKSGKMRDLDSIPSAPGVYLFSSNKVIYIGKAKDLKKRVKSYFQKGLTGKTRLLVEEAKDIDFIETDTEVEALILENTLIKKHRPKYNIELKDSKRYAYLKITDEEYPRLLTVRNKSGKVYGPFVSGHDRQKIQKALTKIFRIRTCKRFPKRPCLRYHIKLCDAPCVGLISKEDYSEEIRKAEMVLRGNTRNVIEELQSEMKAFSQEKNFEKALQLREQIHALERIEHHQKMDRRKKYDEDIINYLVKDGKVYLMLFNVYKGTLANKDSYVFDDAPGFFEDFISQYYDENEIPNEIILPQEIDGSILEKLSGQRGSNVRAVVPQKGEKKKLLKLVKKNITHYFFGNIEKVKALKKSLSLTFYPNIIECFDVSHLGGTLTTGSMVQFRNGLPDKSNYRRFKIRSYEGSDDYSGIGEIVFRRYRRLKKEERDFPDLIVIDGGLPQLNSATKQLQELDLKIPVISLAKRLEEIYIPHRDPIQLDEKDKGLLFLRQIRDEAHRFALKYNRKLRSI